MRKEKLGKIKLLSSKTNIQSIHNREKEEIEQKKQMLDADIKLIKDTLHEVRKINNQIKSSAEQLSETIEFQDFDKDIRNIVKNIQQNSNLLSIRMDAYDMLSKPQMIGSEMVISMCVYKKIEKIYKCLHSERVKKGLTIHLGANERSYRLSNTFELAIFIILENAIKYSTYGNEINVIFIENGDNMDVEFSNIGIRPLEKEIPQLTNRGFRSSKVINTDIKGSGLGLYLLQQICDFNNVKVQIIIGDEKMKGNGSTYSQFTVRLSFSEIYLA